MSLRPVLLAAALVYPAGSAAQALREFRIDMTSATTAVPKELEVDDWSRARVTVTKKMFHSCTVETKTEALPAPPNPVAQILSVLGPFVGGGAPKPEATDRAEAGLEAQIDALVKDAEFVLGQLKQQSLEIEELVKGLPGRVALRSRQPGQSLRRSDDRAGQARYARGGSSGDDDGTRASTTLLASRAAELAKTLTGRMVQAKPEEGPWLKNAFDRLRWAQENIEYAADRRAAIIKARDALLVIRERLIAFRPSTEAVFPVTPAGNARMMATVTCLNGVTQQLAIYTAKNLDT